jgi:hypothetical protein
MKNLFPEGIGNLFGGNDFLLQKTFEDFISPAFQILFGFFIEITMLTDQIDQGLFIQFHPPTQETTALAVEECVNVQDTIATINLPCFGGFRLPVDDPQKP